MTIKLPTQYGTQLTNDWLGLSDIKALEWDELIAAGHLVYARLVSEMGGHVFEPTWQQTSTVLTYQSNSASRDLDEVGLGGFAEREVSGGDVNFAVVGIVEETVLDYTITNLATSTQLATGSVSRTSFGLLGDAVTIARSDVVDSNGRPQYLDIDVKASATSDGNAKIWQIRAGERELFSASDLPTG